MTAFPEPERSLWACYADSLRRPRGASALRAEQAAAMRRLAARPPIVAPEKESRDAYVRRSGDMIYICPWQTRLRSWLALARLRETRSASLADAFLPRPAAERVVREFERWMLLGRSAQPHIRSSTWHVPAAWFVPFGAGERCLVLGAESVPGPAPSQVAGGWREEHAGPGHVQGPKMAAQPRALLYVTWMSAARARVDRALEAVRSGLADTFAHDQIEVIGRWLAGFHASALVELDYGGLVRLLDDEALRDDQSVAEAAVAVAALERGEATLAVAMYKRLLTRWHRVQALESAN